ncbi:cytochrome P450 [Arthrobacter sp. NPDC058127]|uniref:cytochrome P450 n=1 Tax=Arthrobacter sp. NPDC058127 TaxID=3346351 RepID=UPI0036E11974
MSTDLALPDLTDPATFVPGIPHAAFDDVRRQPGLHWHPSEFGTYNGGFWLVTRYADVVAAEADVDTFSSVPGAFFPLGNQELTGPMSKHILFMDPPDHTRVRKVASRAFGPKVIAQFGDWVRGVIDEVLDKAIPLGEFDWVEQVARQIPARVISVVMGVPAADQKLIVKWADDIFRGQAASEDGSLMAEAFQAVGGYMMDLGARKLVEPADDLISLLARALEDGELDAAEYTMYCTALIVAGYDTTNTLLAQSARILLEDHAAAEVVADAFARGKQREVVEELLRLITPAMSVTRTATRDLEFAGQQIRKNDVLMLHLSAANRDPEVFSDPHTFDPFRTGMPTLGYGRDGLAFGSGIHRCVGSMLAKLELRILLEEMNKRGVKLELTGEPKRGWSAMINQLTALPVLVA